MNPLGARDFSHAWEELTACFWSEGRFSKEQVAWDTWSRRPPPCHGGGWDDDVFAEPRTVKLVADVRAR